MFKKIAAVCTAVLLSAGLAFTASPAFADEAPPPEVAADTTAPVVEDAPAAPIVEPEPVVVPDETVVEPAVEEPAVETPEEEPALAPSTVSSLTVARPSTLVTSYVTAAWNATEGDIWNPAQTIVTSTVTDSPSLGALDSYLEGLTANLKCGTSDYFQVDVYYDDKVTAELIGGGVLYGPNDPTEHLIPGGEGTAWKYVKIVAPDCEVPVAKVDFGITPATCTVGQTLVEGEAVNATWDDSAAAAWGTEGPADYDISATAADGAVGDQFVDGVAHFTGHLNSPDASLCTGPNHHVEKTKECGAASVTLTNPEADLTASFVIWVDGNFYGAYAVAGNDSEVVNFSFAEDTGNHWIKVEKGSAQGGDVLLKFKVHSDCIPPQPEDYYGYTEWTDGQFNCGDTTVDQTRYAQHYVYVLVEGEWVAQTDGDPTIEHQSRDLTEEEQFNCPITPDGPSSTDSCGTVDDGWWVPEDVGYGTYVASDETVNGAGNIVVTFTPSDGFEVSPPVEGDHYILVEGSAVWTLTLTNEACPVHEVPKTPASLAHTGGPSVPWYVGVGSLGGALLFVGLLFLLQHLRRRESAE